jgi:hypothetical protein
MAKNTAQLDFGLLVFDPEAVEQEQRRNGRTCLCCRKTFLSAHAGHSICDGCKASVEWQAAVPEYTIAF